jgi:hypothetical protein
MKTYSHTQKGTAIVGAMLLFGVVLLILGFCVAKPLFITAAFLLIVGWLFHSMTVEIGEGTLSWYFGSGLINKRVALSEIVSAVPVKNRSSWGIHWSPRLGWLYNVSGFDAVLVTLRSGSKFTLGTDEPTVLVQAILGHIK